MSRTATTSAAPTPVSFPAAVPVSYTDPTSVTPAPVDTISPLAHFILSGLGAPGQLAAANPGAFVTGAKAAISATPDMLANVSSKIDTGVNALNQLIYPKSWNVPQLKSPTSFVPSSLQVTPQEKLQHPLANLVGSIVGGAPLIAATEGTAADALPALADLKTAAATSKLSKLAYLMTQGSGQGALYAPPGSSTQGAVLGLGLGTLGGLADVGVNALPGALKTIKTLVNPAVLNRSLESATNATHVINDQINSLEPEAQSAVDAANEAQGQQLSTLPAGATHESALGEGLDKYIINKRNSFNPIYEGIKNRASQINITPPDISDLSDMPQYSSDLADSLTPKSTDTANEDKIGAENALNILNTQNTSTPEQINGSDLISLYKATRDAANRATSVAKAFNTGEDIKIPARAKANRLNAIKGRLQQTMQNNFPSDLMNNLNETDTAYGQQVMPFYRNRSFNMISKEGTVPGNFIKSIAGNKPQRVIMQQAIQSDPELTRLALGQKYAGKPQNLINSTPADAPYIAAHAPTQNLLVAQKSAQDNFNQVTNMVKAIKSENPYTQGQIASKILDDNHRNQMISIQNNQKSALEKLAAVTKEKTHYNRARVALGGFLGLGLEQYLTHRFLFDEMYRR